ncbi:hypothetical protein GYMLUDRAFT_70580 [Collybiopsis luxurians FD-317 M1]|nr:hypothetical protein GYMLUDRAFT_70580 [Collybiopsis luxurians FD-317 M1]
MASDEQSNGVSNSFFADILQPGSSLHPTFILILDFVLLALLIVLLGLVFASSGNIHFIALTVVELALWASIKWFLYELKNAPPDATATASETQDSKKNL